VALWISASKGHSKLVDILLNYGVEVEAMHPMTGDSALQLAILSGDQETISVLRAHGASSLSIDLNRLEYQAKTKRIII